MNSAAQILDRAASLYPDNFALEDEDGTLTYTDLRKKSRAAAAVLLKCGLNRETPVAVYLPKGKSCAVWFYAALYCGVPYAPLDFSAPAERIKATLDNLCPGRIVTDAEGREKLAGIASSEIMLDAAVPDNADEEYSEQVDAALRDVIDSDPAYIMYTSGSTGTPKGVVIPHRGIIDYAEWVMETFRIDDETVIGLQSGFHFDNSVFDLYAGALGGAKVTIIPEILFRYPVKLMEYVRDKQVSCVFWVPTVMISAANSGALDNISLPELKTVVFAGEVMPNKQLNIWRRVLPDALFANLYGPTEITVDCTGYVVDREFKDDEPLPIGYERTNMRVTILRKDGTEAAPMEAGELCVSGSQLALGYWNAIEETEQAFRNNIRNNAWKEMLYHTGDLAYRREDGLIEYVGREDSQIKLRGNRIEMGDIEAAARGLKGIDNVCAVFDERGERIVLFVETAQEISSRRFKMELGKKLPRYMLPAEVVAMEKLPLNANRKIDRTKLKALSQKEGKELASMH